MFLCLTNLNFLRNIIETVVNDRSYDIMKMNLSMHMTAFDKSLIRTVEAHGTEGVILKVDYKTACW